MLRLLRPHWPLLSRRRAALAVVFVLGLVGAAVSLSTPLVGMAFVDAVATRHDYAPIPAIAGALVAIAVLDLGLSTLSGRVHARLSADVLADLRAALFSRCVDGPLDAIEALRHGDLLTRFGGDVPRVEGLLVDGLLGALQNLLFLAVASAITASLSPPLAFWSFGGLALALVAANALRNPVEAGTRRVRDAMTDLSHFLSERLGALRAIRLHGTAREDARALDAANARLKREVVRYQLVDAASAGAPGLVLTLALAWIYVAGGRLLEEGAITLGTFVAFVLYQGRLFVPAQGLVGLVRHLQQARVSLERVAEVLGERDTARDRSTTVPATASGAHAVELRDVSFAYPGKPAALAGVDLAVSPGERIALFGASGAGKSTLVQLLFGLREPAAGVVLVEGLPPERARAASRGAAIGYAGAEPFLLHASVEANLRYGHPGASRADVERAAALAEASAFIEALPEGYATIVGGRGLALSDGQRQRLGLARLILRAPRILVLDEAFSALDLDTEIRIRRNLWHAFPDRTAIVISHRPVGLREIDRILFLRDGRLAPAAPAEILSFAEADAGRAAAPTAIR